MKAFFVILSILLISITGNATTFYISTNGNNSNAGTQASPWKTLVYACQNTNPGDIIHVMAGNYTETNITINLAVGVSIEGEGLGTTIIKSSVNGQWSTFLNLESPQDTQGNQSISNITFDGQYVSESNVKTWIGIWITGRSNVVIHDCSIINFYNRGVVYAGVPGSNPLTDPGHQATGNKFYNNTVLNCATNTGNYGAGALNIGTQLGMEIYNNTIIQDQRVAFKNGWPIKYWENGFLRGVKIHDNILKKAYYQGTYPGQNGDWDFCIELFNISGLEIYNNQIQGCIDLNYNYPGSYPYSVWIHNNTQDHQPINSKFESGIILEFATINAIIENNIINNSSSGIQFNTRGVGNSGGYNYPAPPGGYSALTNNIIRGNQFSNIYQTTTGSGGVGIGVFSEGTDDPQINGLFIYNNTIIAKSGAAPYIGVDLTSMPKGKGTNVNVRNNIVQGFNGSWLQGSTTTNLSNVTITNNDAYINGSNIVSFPGGNPSTYTGTPNFIFSPLLTSDYHLQSTSPCIGAGINVCCGNDLGCYQSGSTPPPPNQCTYTYSLWSACVNGTQTRTVTSALPTGCTGTPVTSQTCTITQIPPTVNIGADETFTITLGLSGTTTGNIVTYLWTKVSGPSGTPTFSPNNSLSTTVTNLKKGTYIFRLTVTDANGLKASDDKTVIIQ